ncbi:hypothetical protein ACI8AC_24805 [Geodermatophilus sp. SYSU D00758]
MTSPSGRQRPDDAEDRSPATGSSESDGAPGVELGMSEKSGGTFEPEEAPGEDERPGD